MSERRHARGLGASPTTASVLTFTGALLTVGALELLIVVVPPAVLADSDESRLTVVAYHARFGTPVVLMAQDTRGAPRYFGPDRITPLVAATPFELIPWRQFRYRVPAWELGSAAQLPAPVPPRAYQLPTGGPTGGPAGGPDAGGDERAPWPEPPRSAGRAPGQPPPSKPHPHPRSTPHPRPSPTRVAPQPPPLPWAPAREVDEAAETAARRPSRVTLQMPVAHGASLPTVPLDTMDLLTSDHGN